MTLICRPFRAWSRNTLTAGLTPWATILTPLRGWATVLAPGPKLWCRFAALFVLLLPSLSLAQVKRLQMVKIHDKITIDGVLDEKAWETAPVADNFTQQEYGFGTNASLDATLNTDFSQVEADQQQINLTRFSILFPEKREFFLENSSIFGFAELGPLTPTGGNGMGSPGRLSGGGNDLLFFFSRRIGISDDGRSIPVLGGGRLTGRSGPWSFGFMDVATPVRARRPKQTSQWRE